MGKRRIEKKSEYEIGDIVFARDVDIRGMPGEYEIMSGPRRGLFGIYYKTRYNRKDYIHGLPDRHTGRIYKKKIEGTIEQAYKKELEKKVELLEKVVLALCRGKSDYISYIDDVNVFKEEMKNIDFNYKREGTN